MRKLVCCFHDQGEFTPISREYVMASTRGYDHLSSDAQEEMPENNYLRNNDNEISRISKEAGWEPTLKIIIHRTDQIKNIETTHKFSLL